MLDFETKQKIKNKIYKKFEQVFCSDNFSIKIDKKKDNSIVTEIDIYVSKVVKEELGKITKLKDYIFFSEEDHSKLSYPAIIVDPIDGTNELSEGFPECALSVSIMKNNSIDNYGWIYNPFNGFDISTDQIFHPPVKHYKNKKIGMISRSEWSKGLYKDFLDEDIILFPKGSIANKLALLGAGACDFVVSLWPKNIWDIAGGTSICSTRGISLYIKGKKISTLDLERYSPPFLWCRDDEFEDIYNRLSENIF